MAETYGTCAFCGKRVSGRGMTRHLKACKAWRDRVQPDGKDKIFHLRVTNAYGGPWWLHLAVRGSTTLRTLDEYLRAIWLECCGHLSHFTINGVEYAAFPARELYQRSQRVKVQDVLEEGMEFGHVYDYGSTTELTLKVVEVREGKWPFKHSIYLMARNEPPVFQCAECEAPATLICSTCIWEDPEEAFVCDEHAEEHMEEWHPEEDYFLPIVNSPRTGVCAYEGPDEPPY